jgi:hypothetical protein
MYRRNILSLTIMALGLAMLPGSAMSQQKSMKEQISGAWTLVSVDQTSPDGKKEQLFGPNPKGVMILDPSGQYVLIITRPGREKFKATAAVRARQRLNERPRETLKYETPAERAARGGALAIFAAMVSGGWLASFVREFQVPGTRLSSKNINAPESLNPNSGRNFLLESARAPGFSISRL